MTGSEAVRNSASNAALVLAERDDNGVCTVTLNRPEKRNALSIELRFALAAQLSALADDRTCHGAVLTGAGTAFCAGMDFRNLAVTRTTS